MVQPVTAADIGQIDDGDAAGPLQLAADRLLGGVEGADALHASGKQARNPQGLVVARDQEGEMGPVRAQNRDLLGEDVHVQVRRGEDHILDLWVDPSLADRVLAQRLDRDPAAHRMSHDGDLGHIRIARGQPEQLFQGVA